MAYTQRVYRAAAAVFALMAIAPGYWAFRLPWAPRVDFDIIGFLWALQNLPKLTAVVMTAGFVMAAAYMLGRSLLD